MILPSPSPRRRRKRHICGIRILAGLSDGRDTSRSDLVVALRSGDAYNHEHADRNSTHRQMLRRTARRRSRCGRRTASGILPGRCGLTAGHSSVLIDGKGHQYVDGHEGTNASQASASIIRRGERDGYFFWTSDATSAYALVLPDVHSVTRTVVTLTDPPAVVVVDKVIKRSDPSTIQARFYAYNSDGKGAIAATKDAFTVTRPYARMVGSASSEAGVTYTSAVPDIPAAQARPLPLCRGGNHASRAKRVCLVTVLLPTPSSGVDRDCVGHAGWIGLHCPHLRWHPLDIGASH